MHSAEVIDSLYENDAVEGIALFNAHGDLVENQLALGKEAVVKIGISLNRIREGLQTSRREMNGFLLKTDKYLLQAILHQDAIILLQVDPSSSANSNYLTVKSQLGDRSIIPRPKPTPVHTHVLEPMQAAANAAAAQASHQQALIDAQASAAANADPIVDWEEFRNSLASLIKRVAPSGVANKMISVATIEAGIIVEQGVVDLNTAITVGRNVVAKIPNASRRKLIENEYELLIQRYQP